MNAQNFSQLNGRLAWLLVLRLRLCGVMSNGIGFSFVGVQNAA